MKKKDIVLNKKYIPIKFLNKSNSGSIILSKNAVNKKFIIKEKRFGIVFNKKYTVQDFLKKEFLNIMILKHSKISKYIPFALDIFYKGHSLFLVKKYIEGKTIFEIYNKNKEASFEKKFIFSKLMNLMNIFHSNNWIMNDVKMSNFVVSKKNIYFIDLEHCFNANDEMPLAQMDDIKKHNLSILNNFHADKIKLGFLIMSIFNYKFEKIKKREGDLCEEIIWKLLFCKKCSLLELISEIQKNEKENK